MDRVAGLRDTLCVAAVVGLGLLAGSLMGTGLVAYSAKGLAEANWTAQFQLEDALFSRVMPPVFLGTVALTATATFLTRGAARVLFGVATLLAVVALVVTVRGEVPLNKVIQTWTPGKAPQEWVVVRDLWLRNHILRAVAVSVGFVLAAMGLRRD